MDGSVFIAVPVFNRIDTLKQMSKSFYGSDLDFDITLKIYDDSSTDFSVDVLEELFPNAKIVRYDCNVGADMNMYLMYKDYIHNSSADYFFNADSDLIFCKEWLHRGLHLIEKTDGVISLFNTSNHKSNQYDNDLVLKKDVGAAGVLFRRDILQLVVDTYESKENEIQYFDWQWCKLLNDNNIRIFCVRDSLVQHIGFSGQNADVGSYDFGTNFLVDSFSNGQIINDIFEEYINRTREFIPSVYVKGLLKAVVNRSDKVIFWGAASVASERVVDLIPQLKRGYFVDSNYAAMNTVCGLKVCGPEKLLEENGRFFIIVISYRYYSEIKKRLEDMGFIEGADFVSSVYFERFF